jgi:hypothetical protein
MKTIIKHFMVLAIAVPMLLTSCGEDDKNEDKGDYNYGSYSSLTPEQQKAKLSQDALSFLDKFNGVEDEANKVMGVYQAFMANNGESIVQFFMSAITDTIIKGEDFYAKYNYVGGSSVWSQTPSTSSLEINFRGTTSSTTNDAQIVATVTSTTAVIPLSSEDDDVDYPNSGDGSNFGKGRISKETENNLYMQVPSNLAITLKLSGQELAVGSLVIKDFSTSAIPSQAELRFKLGSYDMVFGFTKNNTDSHKSNLTITKSNETILDANLAAKIDNIDQLLGENSDAVMPGNSNLQVKMLSDLVLVGNVDVKSLNAEMNALDKKYGSGSNYDYEESKAYVDEYVVIFNKYAKVWLSSRNDEVKIADMYAVSVPVLGYQNYYYTDYVLDFGDGVPISAEVYFSKGFESVIAAIESLLPISEDDEDIAVNPNPDR